MSVSTSRVTVATAPTLLVSAGVNGLNVAIRNAGGASIYVGDSSVATSDGFEVAPGETWSGHLGGYDELYGVVAASTETAHVLEIK